MSLNYKTDVKPLEDLGKTDIEIQSTLQLSGVTFKKIEISKLLHELNLRGMLRKEVGNDSNKKWTGTVISMKVAIDAVGTQEQRDGMALWLSHVTNPRNTYWDTTDTNFAAAFWSMFQTFKDQPTMPTTADFEAIAALGGGWKYQNLTTQNITDSRSDEAEDKRVESLESLQTEIENDYLNPALVDGSTTYDQLKALIKAGL